MSEILDFDSAGDWLDGQNHQTRVWFGARSALRCLPALETRSEDLFNGFRAALIASAASRDHDGGRVRFAKAAGAAAEAIADAALYDEEAHERAALSLQCALFTVCDSQQDSVLFARNTLGRTAASARELVAPTGPDPQNPEYKPEDLPDRERAASSIYRAAHLDSLQPLSWPPLWHDEQLANPFPSLAPSVFGHSDGNSRNRYFLYDWYDAILKGTPLPWELTQRIALEITDRHWESGQAVLERRISEIRAAYDVQVIAHGIAESAHLSQPGGPGMGHNQPPSLADDDLPAQAPETIIWVAADELRTQAQAETPTPSRIKRALSLIAGVLKASGLWVAGTVATGISVATVTVVKKGADAWAVQNQDKLVELIDAALKWLSLLF
ncbi:hypothetical protein [uncultured Roseobacter sp.]|uniref:hypothetical protein n=1 Tax=uncultured Roseobacter sp. TaxID=114847 RepID=UPI002609CBFF|nr:hypothetical protein [uncultured Roseobacter sp.]